MWKVVRVDDEGRMWSLNLGPHTLEYWVGKFTHAKPSMLLHGYGICAFSELDTAINWLRGERENDNDNYCYDLYSAEGLLTVVAPSMMMRWASDAYHIGDAEMVEAYKDFGNRHVISLGRKKFSAAPWPANTIIVSQLQLLEKYEL